VCAKSPKVDQKCVAEQIPDPFALKDKSPIMTILFAHKMGADIVKVYMDHPKMKEFLSKDQKFDVCVVEAFNSDAFMVKCSKANGRNDV
jgi:hypothetical protein